jgi:protoheme IX farnesyltransferase
MSTTSVSFVGRTLAFSRLSDYAELTRPRISAMVLVTVAVAACVADWGPPAPWLLFHTLLGTALVAASASALNQWLERDTDQQMQRTAARPLPAGRLNNFEVVTFGATSIALGLVYLAATTGAITAALALVTWTLYVWVYTPLKTRTPANTAVGAMAGALPVLIGWTAVGAPLDIRAWSLFLIVFIWQFPHFMAIAWLYRDQYGAAGLQMLSVVDPTGRRAGAQAIVAALVLIPVSLVPCLVQPAPELYFTCALLLGLGQLACAAGFFWSLGDVSARRLLLASLVYLPAVMGVLVLASVA